MAYKQSIELSSNTTATPRTLRLPKDSRYLAKRIWTALLSSVTCATVLGVPSLIPTTLTTTLTTPWGLQIQRSNEAAIAQTVTPPVLPASLPQGASLTIEGSGSLAAINKALKEQYESRYKGTPVRFSTEGTAAGLKALAEGKVDLAAIGRTLTPEEIAKGFIAIPIKREKIAMLVGENNPFRGSLTIHQFAKIFRGEITNWSEVGGPNKPIRLIDQPESSDTRNAFPNYPVFKSAPFQAVSSAVASGSENPQDVASKLGDDGLGYITADGLTSVTGARALDMHQTQPDDPRYPFSQPIAYVYKKGRLSPAAQAFLGSLNTEEAKAAIQAVSSPGVVLADSSALVGAAIAGAVTGSATGTPGAPGATAGTPTGSPSPAASESPVAAIGNNAPAGSSNSTDAIANTPANASGNEGAAGAMATTNPVEGGFPFWLWPVLLGLGAAGLLWWLLKGKEGNRSTIAESPSSPPEIPSAGVERGGDVEGNVLNLDSPNLDPNLNPDLLPIAGLAGVATGAAALAATGLPIVETDPRNQALSARILPEGQEPVVAIDHDVEIHGEGSAEISPREVQGDAGGLQFPAIDPVTGAAVGLAGGAVVAGLAAGATSEPSRDAVEPMDSTLIVEENVKDVEEDVVVGGELTAVATPIVAPDLPSDSIADSDELEPPITTLSTSLLSEPPISTDRPNESVTDESVADESVTDESARSGVLPLAGIAGAAAVAGIAGGVLSHDGETPQPEAIDKSEDTNALESNLEEPSAITVEEPIVEEASIEEPIVPAVMLPHEPITQLPPAIQEPTVLESLDIQASSSQSFPNEPMQSPSNEFPEPISQNDEQNHEPNTDLNIEPNNIALGMVGAAGIATGIAANTTANTTVNRSLTPADLAGVDDQLPDLPQGYGESRIVLMARDPQWGYTYWDVPDEHRQVLRDQGGQQLALRLYDVTDLDINTQNSHSLQQYACDELARDWYLPIPVSDRDYITEIGYLSGTGAWLLLARSNIVRIPPVYPSDWMDDQFITVDFEENLQGRTFLQLVPPGSLAAQSQGQAREFNNPVFGVSQADQAARMAGSLFGSMHQIPTEALSSFVFPSGAGLWANESGAEFWTLPTPSGMGMSGVGYTMSGIGLGASIPPERSRKFWLVADAELIIYGATEPDAQLTIGGVPVQLSPEGTFRLQMSFQDGNLDFPIMAIAKDGEQMRQIRMTFDRSTPLRKTNTKEEAQEENY